MDTLSVDKLLDEYAGWVKKGDVRFLKDDPKKQEEILGLIDELKKALPEDPEKLDWHEAHKRGQKLWKALASHALHSLDRAAKGNSELFKFLVAATEFEDLLYGLEKYYRDHTLHSLWVYLIGEHILRKRLPEVYDDLNWYVYNDIEIEKPRYPAKLLAGAREREKKLLGKANEKKDAIWCLMALCHDLGYSLAKLSNLNEKITNVLKYFDISNLQRVGYSLEIEHQYIVSQFLELMAADVHIVPSADEKMPLIKCYRDDSTYWRLCRALEKREHGILSAYLVYKILLFFADVSVRGPAEDWGLDDNEAVNDIIRGTILFGISQHEFQFAHLNELGGLDEVLVLADELEEFSRYGRQLQSRKYYHTTADPQVSFKTGARDGRKYIDIDIVYEVASDPSDLLKPFFKRKIDFLCRRYSLEQEEENGNQESKYYRIRRITMTAKGKEETLWVRLCDDPSKNKAYLPKTTVYRKKGKTDYEAKEYEVRMRDDKMYVVTDRRGDPSEYPSLDEWIPEENIAQSPGQ